MRLSTKSLSHVNTKSFFVAFVIAVGVISFLVTGVGFQMGRLDENSAAQVGNQIVTMRNLGEVVQQLNAQAGTDLNDEKRQANIQSALSQLIQEKVLVEEAVRMGFSANDLEVAAWIRRLPAFQNEKTKQFDKTLYQKFIKSGQMSELELFNRGREALAQDKMYALFQLPAYVPTSIVTDAAKRDELQFEVESLELKPSDAAVKTATDEEAKKFATDAANEKTLKDAYEAAKAEFRQKAAVHLKSILVSFKGAERAEGEALNRSEAEAKAAAEDALSKLKGGESFEALSVKLNDDARAKATKGDLGFVDESGVDPDSAKIIFTLNKDKRYSEVVKTPFGFRIYEWVASRPAVEKTFEDVKLELAHRQVSPPVRARLSTELENEVKAKLPENERAGLDAVLKKHALEWKKVQKPITGNSRYIEELGMADSLLGPIFALKKPGDITQNPVDTAGRKLLIRLVSRKEGAAPDEKKLSQTRRMMEMRTLQTFVGETQKVLVDVYTRNKEIVRNDNVLSLR